MNFERTSTTSFTFVTDSENNSESNDSGVFWSPGRKLLRSSKLKLKLIALYADNKCLWNEGHRDFFNFDHKAKIWKAIADEMKVDSPPDFWKHRMHRLRYNVVMERLKEQQSKYLGEQFKSKLSYADHMQFLNRIFAREKDGPHKEMPMQAPPSGVTLAKHPSTQKSGVKEKPKSRPKVCEKLASLEVLRNHQCSHLVLSHEAFQKMEKITGSVDHGHSAKEKPKAKHV